MTVSADHGLPVGIASLRADGVETHASGRRSSATPKLLVIVD
jgi:hypothetical protein